MPTGIVAQQLALFPPDAPRGDDPERPRQIDPATSPALGDQVSEYQVYLARVGKAGHTLAAVRRDLAQLALFLGERRVDQVALADLQRFLDSLRGDRDNGVASLRRKIATTKAFFRFVRRRELIQSDPSALLPYPPPLEREPAPLSPREVERLLVSAESSGHRALFLAMIDGGLKREELLALRAADVELRSPDGSFLVVKRGLAAKRVRARTVPLTPRLAEALGERLLEIEAGAPIFGLSTRGVDYVVREAAERAGVPARGKLTPQRLRDTFAVRWLLERLDQESAAPDADARRELEAAHERELVELLGLAPATLAVQRYRRTARLEYDRSEAALLAHA